MVCVPTPAVAGSNMPALTPVPLYVPPAGVPPVSVNAAVLIQTDELAGQFTTGNGFIVTVTIVELAVARPELQVTLNQ